MWCDDELKDEVSWQEKTLLIQNYCVLAVICIIVTAKWRTKYVHIPDMQFFVVFKLSKNKKLKMGGIFSYLYHPWCDWGRGETGRGIRGSSNLELIVHAGQTPHTPHWTRGTVWGKPHKPLKNLLLSATFRFIENLVIVFHTKHIDFALNQHIHMYIHSCAH